MWVWWTRTFGGYQKHWIIIALCVVLAIVLVVTTLTARSPATLGEYSCSVTNSKIAGIEKSLSAISKALAYYETILSIVNVDSLIAIRLVGDQSQQILDNWKVDTSYANKVDATIYNQLNEITNTCNRLILKSSAYNRDYWSIEDYNLSKRLLNRNFWRNWKHFNKDRQVDPKLIYDSIINEPYMENMTDICLDQISNGKCEICKYFDKMVAPKYNFYMLSHQIFYLIIGKIVSITALYE